MIQSKINKCISKRYCKTTNAIKPVGPVKPKLILRRVATMPSLYNHLVRHPLPNCHSDWVNSGRYGPTLNPYHKDTSICIYINSLLHPWPSNDACLPIRVQCFGYKSATYSRYRVSITATLWKISQGVSIHCKVKLVYFGTMEVS